MLVYDVPGIGQIPAGTAFKLLVTVDPGGDAEPYQDLVAFPRNWLELASPESLSAHGIATVEVEEPEPQAPMANDLKDYAAERRRAVIWAGTTVDVGSGRLIPVWTDAESQAAITALVVASQFNTELTTDWKGSDGAFYEIDVSEILALAHGMMAHVQAAFQCEAAVLAEIDLGAIADTAQIDAAEWPGST